MTFRAVVAIATTAWCITGYAAGSTFTAPLKGADILGHSERIVRFAEPQVTPLWPKPSSLRIPPIWYHGGCMLWPAPGACSEVGLDPLKAIGDAMLTCSSVTVFVTDNQTLQTESFDLIQVSSLFRLVIAALDGPDDDVSWAWDEGLLDRMVIPKTFFPDRRFVFVGPRPVEVWLDIRWLQIAILDGDHSGVFSLSREQMTALLDFVQERTPKPPNQSLEPTSTAVTPRAGARVAPAVLVAHH